MTVAQLIDNLNLSPMLKRIVKTFAVARYPEYLGKVVSLTMDGDKGVVSVCLDNKPFLSKTFDELEAFINGPQETTSSVGSTAVQTDNAKNPSLDSQSPGDSGPVAKPQIGQSGKGFRNNEGEYDARVQAEYDSVN